MRRIERIRWNLLGRAGVSAFAPISPNPMRRSGPRSDDSQNDGRDRIEELREDIYAVGTLGALNYVVRGMHELPGRKSVLLMSDGLRIINREGTNPRVFDSLRRLTDLANRSSVVVYTIDARGLQTLGLTAADSTGDLTAQELDQQMDNRRRKLFDTQQGLDYLARQTGGFAIRNSNDLGGGIRRVLDDQRGYYLIGYAPESSTFRIGPGPPAVSQDKRSR
jgi:VWFA-related protein